MQEPAKIALQIQDLGIDISMAEGFLFWIVVGLVLVFCISMAIQEQVEWYAFYSQHVVWSSLFKGMQIYARLCASIGLLPLLKHLMYPLSTDGDLGLTHQVTAMCLIPCLLALSFRLARVDYQLSDLEIRMNFFDWTLDRQRSHAMRELSQIHPLSSQEPIYDIVAVAVKMALLLNKQFVAHLCGVAIAAGLRVLIGVALLSAGVYYDQYFDPPNPKIWHWNSISTGLDAGLVYIFLVSFLAVVKGPDAVDETWFSCMMALCPLMILLGSWLRMVKTRRRRASNEQAEVHGYRLLPDREVADP